MKRNEFLEEIKQKLEIEQDINENTSLSDIEEWDSLAAVTVLAMFKRNFDLGVAALDIKNSKTIKDILDLGEGKYE